MEYPSSTPHASAESKPADPLDTSQDILLYPHIELPADFDEPGQRYNYTPYGHTPLDPFSSTEVIEHQTYFKKQVGELITAHPVDGIDPQMMDLFDLDFQAGIAHREMKSSGNFNQWLSAHPDELDMIHQDPELEWFLGEALTGRGKPGGLLRILKHAPSLHSLDLQVLTTPYGYRREHLPAMRKELRAAVEDLGGIYNPNGSIEPDKIKIAPHYRYDNDERKLQAILATYKRRVGVMYADEEQRCDAINIIERHAVVMRVDEASGFPQGVVNVLEQPSSPQAVADAEARIRRLILDQQPNDFITPNSVMTYAYRHPREAAVEPEKSREHESNIPESLLIALGESGLDLATLRATN